MPRLWFSRRRPRARTETAVSERSFPSTPRVLWWTLPSLAAVEARCRECGAGAGVCSFCAGVKIWTLPWKGHISTTEEASVMEISKDMADCMGIKPKTSVRITLLDDLPHITKAIITPMDDDADLSASLTPHHIATQYCMLLHPASSSNLPPSPSPRHQLALTDERRRWGATEHEDAVDEHPGAMVRGEGADKEEEEAPPTEKKSRLLPSISTAAPPSSSRIFLPSRRSQSPPR
ncbi:hypothetical protein OsJ_30354 [Oryza sativa Japonica Group]|uniref:Uncharacterized protein n=1 Tax=Oryza sativa subsp. japonica TaxID=39947 RepID=B9G540_ORYSJ|nr:hypothetical protein OsJ_30354 [Oryza sativa Japonica Group]